MNACLPAFLPPCRPAGLSVRQSVCVCFVLVLIARLYEAYFHKKKKSMGAGKYGLTSGACSVARRSEVVVVAALFEIS